MGLAREITVVKGAKFREWLAGEGEFTRKKFRKKRSISA